MTEIEGRDETTNDPRDSSLISVSKWSPLFDTGIDQNDVSGSLIASSVNNKHGHPTDRTHVPSEDQFTTHEAFQPAVNHDADIDELRHSCQLSHEMRHKTSSWYTGKCPTSIDIKSFPESSELGDLTEPRTMKLFAPRKNELKSDNMTNHIDFGIQNTHRTTPSTRYNASGQYNISQEQFSCNSYQTPRKSDISGSTPRVVQTPHGPALLLTTPSSVMSNRVTSPLLQHPSSQQRKFQRWSDDEDAILRYAISCEDELKPNWKKISSNFFLNTRTPLQCKSRWTKCLQPGILIGGWKEHEDETIRHLRAEGFRWSQIAEHLPGRIGEHVRDRYVNFLDPDLKKVAWTKAEDRILFEQQKLQGNKWTAIAKFLPGRSENAVKNRWHNAKMTQRRRMRKHAAERTLESRSLRARQHAETSGSDEESLDENESFDEDM